MFKLTFYLKHIKEEKIKGISNSQRKKKRQRPIRNLKYRKQKYTMSENKH